MPIATTTKSGVYMILKEKKEGININKNPDSKFFILKEIKGKEVYKEEITEHMFRAITTHLNNLELKGGLKR